MTDLEIRQFCSEKEYPEVSEINRIDYICWKIADLLTIEMNDNKIIYNEDNEIVPSNRILNVLAYLHETHYKIIIEFHKFEPYKKIYVRDCIIKYLHEHYIKRNKMLTAEITSECKQTVLNFLRELFKLGYADFIHDLVQDSDEDIEEACKKNDWFLKI